LHQFVAAPARNWGELGTPGRSVRLSKLGLRRDPHGSVKQIHHEELEDAEKERPNAFLVIEWDVLCRKF
jgi:hypothetical protein